MKATTLHSSPIIQRRAISRVRRFLGSVVLAVGASLFAQSDNFDSGTDSGWTRYDPLAAFGAPASFTFPNGGYRIQAPASPNPGTLGQARAGSIRADGTYGTFSISVDLVDWNNSLNQAFGILGRTSTVGLGTTKGYAFNYNATAHQLQINRVNNEAATTIGQVSLTLDPTHDYRFVFTGDGSSLSGQVFDVAALSTSLATVSATDATFSSGNTGVFVFDRTGPGTADATFDNFVAAVPEPSTIGLVLCGLAGLLAPRTRRLRM
jgi:hypothetical protein